MKYLVYTIITLLFSITLSCHKDISERMEFPDDDYFAYYHNPHIYCSGGGGYMTYCVYEDNLRKDFGGNLLIEYTFTNLKNKYVYFIADDLCDNRESEDQDIYYKQRYWKITYQDYRIYDKYYKYEGWYNTNEMKNPIDKIVFKSLENIMRPKNWTGS